MMPEMPPRLRSFEAWLALTPGEDPAVAEHRFSEAECAARHRYEDEFGSWYRANGADPVEALRARARWKINKLRRGDQR